VQSRPTDGIHKDLVFVVRIVRGGLIVFWEIDTRLIAKLFYNLFFILNV
jgi:hypothetical protein